MHLTQQYSNMTVSSLPVAQSPVRRSESRAADSSPAVSPTSSTPKQAWFKNQDRRHSVAHDQSQVRSWPRLACRTVNGSMAEPPASVSQDRSRRMARTHSLDFNKIPPVDVKRFGAQRNTGEHLDDEEEGGLVIRSSCHALRASVCVRAKASAVM